MADPSSRISSGVGGRPTEGVDDCAVSITVAAHIADAMTSDAVVQRLRVDDGPISTHLPELDAVVVVDGICAPHGDKGLARRLDVARLVDRAGGDHRLTALESPRQAKPRERDREPRLLKLRS